MDLRTRKVMLSVWRTNQRDPSLGASPSWMCNHRRYLLSTVGSRGTTTRRKTGSNILRPRQCETTSYSKVKSGKITSAELNYHSSSIFFSGLGSNRLSFVSPSHELPARKQFDKEEELKVEMTIFAPGVRHSFPARSLVTIDRCRWLLHRWGLYNSLIKLKIRKRHVKKTCRLSFQLDSWRLPRSVFERKNIQEDKKKARQAGKMHVSLSLSLFLSFRLKTDTKRERARKEDR